VLRGTRWKKAGTSIIRVKSHSLSNFCLKIFRIMEKIMKSMSLDEPKFSTTSNYGNLVSHYCESPKNDASERLSRSVSGSGEFPTPDKKTLGHNLASSVFFFAHNKI
jgi:hypothetical protein